MELLHLMLNDGLSPLDRKPADHEGSVKPIFNSERPESRDFGR
jgi:hypothetical protein